MRCHVGQQPGSVGREYVSSVRSSRPLRVLSKLAIATDPVRNDVLVGRRPIVSGRG